jgi:arginyl-tRNA--protein-N-Asp/Glu arginylyltransferase
MSGQFDKYFHDITLECPYGLARKAVYRQAQFSFMPDNLMKFFLVNGFRRNGNYIYSMVCDGCDSCVPIRVAPLSFVRNRNQKRVWRKNQDLKIKISPLQINNEKLAICDKFLQTRFPGKGNSALDYYAGFFVNSLDCTYEIEMWDGDYLIGVSIVDIIDDIINCVYFYFDPVAEKRSPGTFNILYLVDYALKQEFKHVYLGYYIKELSAMAYKSNFKPHSLLIDGEWRNI